MDITTPNWARGKPGLYAIKHNTETVYIGKAQYGNAVFKEAKNRENKWVKQFKIHDVLPQNISATEARNYVRSHCKIFVAIIDKEELKDLIGDMEELLIFKLKKQLICNDIVKSKENLRKDIVIENIGKVPF